MRFGGKVGSGFDERGVNYREFVDEEDWIRGRNL